MALTVRIRNFQSIREATLVIKGFTVITGTNNSGKTAMIRAIRGVFTNPPAGPLVRHGAAYLSVEITFSDGQVVLWEKGWEKPDQKGATINRYTLNGKVLSGVGRGVPEEVEALGVQAISAGTEKLWPQVADQFKGTLFLVGATGSTVAEAVADVDRVGRLSEALKLSEKDRRAVSNVLKVRRKDEDTLTKELGVFDGLDAATDMVDALAPIEQQIRAARAEFDAACNLRDRLASSRDAVAGLAGVREVVVPAPTLAQEASKAQQGVQALVQLRSRLQARQEAVKALRGVADAPEIPSGKTASEHGLQLHALRILQTRRNKAQVAVDRLAPISHIDIPTADIKINQAREALTFFENIRDTMTALTGRIATIQAGLVERTADLDAVENEIHEILGGVGMCPTCRRPVEA